MQPAATLVDQCHTQAPNTNRVHSLAPRPDEKMLRSVRMRRCTCTRCRERTCAKTDIRVARRRRGPRAQLRSPVQDPLDCRNSIQFEVVASGVGQKAPKGKEPEAIKA